MLVIGEMGEYTEVIIASITFYMEGVAVEILTIRRSLGQVDDVNISLIWSRICVEMQLQ